MDLLVPGMKSMGKNSTDSQTISVCVVVPVLNEANKNNLEPINQLLQILKNPYIYKKNINEYQVPPVSNKKYQTFCGT